MFTRASRRASWATESTPCKYCFNYQSLSTLNRAKVVNDEHDGQYRNNNNTHPECSMLGWGCKEQYAKWIVLNCVWVCQQKTKKIVSCCPTNWASTTNIPKKNTVMHRNCCFTCIVEPIGVEESTSSEDNLCGTVAADGGAIDFTQHLRRIFFQSRGRLVKSPDINNKQVVWKQPHNSSFRQPLHKHQSLTTTTDNYYKNK